MHIFYQNDPALHPVNPAHPERPHRLMAAAAGLGRLSSATWVPLKTAGIREAGLIHDQEYLNRLSEPFKGTEVRSLDHGDTIQSKTSLEAALGAIGGSRTAISGLMTDKFQKAMILSRSPGHHACRAEAMGFCLLGSAAWAAIYARNMGLRVAVIDFDLHHGNGTEDILKDQPDIFFASSQQTGIWPGTGSTGVSGKFNHIHNTELPGRSGSSEMRNVWTNHLQELRIFNPDLIVVSAGFDAHQNDPLSGLRWKLNDYQWIGQAIAYEAEQICEGKVLCILEGGYDLKVLQEGIFEFTHALSGSASHAEQSAPECLLNLSPMSSPYIKGSQEPTGGGFVLHKMNKRLWISNGDTGEMLYTPPGFIRLNDRRSMIELVKRSNERGKISICDIIDFEHSSKRSYGYNNSKCAVEM